MKTDREGAFPSTRWSLVERMQTQGPESAEALEELCHHYWFPIYAFLRQNGNRAADAEDLTQSFFAHLLQREILRDVSSDQGKLRSFLLRILRNHKTDTWRKAQAERRGGAVLILDSERAEVQFRQLKAEGLGAAEVFDRSWFLGLLHEAKEELRGSFIKRGRPEAFDALAPFLDTDSSDGEELEEAAEALGIRASSMRVTVHRLREKYRTLLRQRIRDTLSDETQIDEEVAYFSHLFDCDS